MRTAKEYTKLIENAMGVKFDNWVIMAIAINKIRIDTVEECLLKMPDQTRCKVSDLKDSIKSLIKEFV